MTQYFDNQSPNPSSANILDLTNEKTLFELAIESYELVGQSGAKLIAELKEKAAETDYTHLYFRDPMRPGILWFVGLQDFEELPTRGRLDYCRQVTQKVFPGLLGHIENQCAELESQELDVASVIPNIQLPLILKGVSGFELATALEYLIFVYPEMVRAWAALIFTYSEMLNLKEGAERTKAACLTSCSNPQIVTYFVNGSGSDIATS